MTFLTKWWNGQKEKWNQSLREIEKENEKREQELKVIWDNYNKEQERERKDWELLTPFQRCQIRELRTLRHSQNDRDYESAYAGWGEP